MPNAHLESLTARHARLEDHLADESRRPQPDQSRVTRLKREKLKLKEEINRIGNNTQWNDMNIMDKSFSANGDAGKFKFQVGANEAQTIDLTIGDYRTTTNAPAAGGAALAAVVTAGSEAVEAVDAEDAVDAAAAVGRVVSLTVDTAPAEDDEISITLGDETLTYTVLADVIGVNEDATKANIATAIAALAMPTGYTAAVDVGDDTQVNFTRASGETFEVDGGADFTAAVVTAGSEAVEAADAIEAVEAEAAVPREVSLTFSGTYAENDEIEITLGDETITYTVGADDIGEDDAATLEAITANIAALTMPTGFVAEVDEDDATKINFTRASGETFTPSATFTSESVAGDLSMINDSNISTQADSNAAIISLDAALKTVNEGRAEMGATINRLNYAADNLTNVSQNTSESRSRILDTDYAQATTELARTQIISQAATAMLAQANQAPQSVLSLLR
jgi:flagellin